MEGAPSVLRQAINLPVTWAPRHHNGSLSFCHHSEQRLNISLLEERDGFARALTGRQRKEVCGTIWPCLHRSLRQRGVFKEPLS